MKLLAFAPTGRTLYAVILNGAAELWDMAGGAWTDATAWTNCSVALIETVGGIYAGDLPAGFPATNPAYYVVYRQVGDVPSLTDPQVGGGVFGWDGQAEVAPFGAVIDPAAIWTHTPRTLTTPSGHVAVNYPQQQDGTVILQAGDDYQAAEGYQLEWTDVDGLWPDLTEATIQFNVGVGLTVAGSIIRATGPGKQVRVELTKAHTAQLTPGTVYYYNVRAILANQHEVTLVRRSRLQIVQGLNR